MDIENRLDEILRGIKTSSTVEKSEATTASATEQTILSDKLVAEIDDMMAEWHIRRLILDIVPPIVSILLSAIIFFILRRHISTQWEKMKKRVWKNSVAPKPYKIRMKKIKKTSIPLYDNESHSSIESYYSLYSSAILCRNKPSSPSPCYP